MRVFSLRRAHCGRFWRFVRKSNGATERVTASSRRGDLATRSKNNGVDLVPRDAGSSPWRTAGAEAIVHESTAKVKPEWFSSDSSLCLIRRRKAWTQLYANCAISAFD